MNNFFLYFFYYSIIKLITLIEKFEKLLDSKILKKKKNDILKRLHMIIS